MYLKELQASFDYGKIKYTEDYYDIEMCIRDRGMMEYERVSRQVLEDGTYRDPYHVEPIELTKKRQRNVLQNKGVAHLKTAVVLNRLKENGQLMPGTTPLR